MNDKFEYTYSAPTEKEKREIESIRKQYSPEKKVQTKMEKLRELNAQVNNPPKIIGIIVGIVGILTFGSGLSMILEWDLLLWGIVVMAIGCLPTALAYPLYLAILKRGKKKYGSEILRLSNELLGNEENENN